MNTNILKSNSGFTLIELIIVIVILGILAVTALPRFIGFGNDARIATLESLFGNIESTANLVFAKCSVSIECNKKLLGSSVNIGATSAIVVYGFPDAGNRLNDRQLDTLINHDGFTAEIVDHRTRFSLEGAPNPETCSVLYREPTSITSGITLTIATEGC